MGREQSAHARYRPYRLTDLPVPVIFRTVLLLTLSNIFMTFAWYGHLRNLSDRKLWIAVLVSWGIALFEYMKQPLRMDFLWAGLCMLGAVYFIFRGHPA